MPLFLYFRLFYKQLTVNKCSIKVADDWIQTWVLWYRKRLLCQLCHNHCPMNLKYFRLQFKGLVLPWALVTTVKAIRVGVYKKTSFCVGIRICDRTIAIRLEAGIIKSL